MTVFKTPLYYECAPPEQHGVTFMSSGCVALARRRRTQETSVSDHIDVSVLQQAVFI